MSPYLLACFDADTDEFQSMYKIGTGFSDEDLQTLSAALNEHAVECMPSFYSVADGLESDVWFEPVQVWEVKAADLSQSSLHRGAMGKTGDPGRGIGLRFPRYERLRPEKKWNRPRRAIKSWKCTTNKTLSTKMMETMMTTKMAFEKK